VVIGIEAPMVSSGGFRDLGLVVKVRCGVGGHDRVGPLALRACSY